MRIGFLQNEPIFGDKDANLEAAGRMLEGVQADLIVLPELFATGYTFISAEEAGELAEGPDGPTARFLRDRARETRALLVAGFAERDGERLFNSALAVGPAGVLGIYRKIHLFNKEKLWFSPGEAPPPVFAAARGAPVGVMICFDWFFPETARSLALAGALVIAHPANLVMPFCQKAMITRSLENRVFTVTANRVGRESRGPDDFHFTGASQATSPAGEQLASAPGDRPALKIVEIDPEAARSKRLNPYNDLFADRRPDLYRL